VIIKNSGQSTLEALFFAPLLLTAALFVTAFLYYFSYQIGSQYYAYQALLCRVSHIDTICKQRFKGKTKVFKGIEAINISFEKKESTKAFKLSVHWHDFVPLVNKKIRRENSVYIPKKI